MFCLRTYLVLILMTPPSALAQMPTYGLGRTPTAEELQAMEVNVGPMGKGLPPGKGTAQEGAAIYAKKCAMCHGPKGQGVGPFPRLAGGRIHPFATTIWDYIYTSMPRSLANPGMREPTLPPDEVYALTAFILSLDKIIEESEVMDAKSLPRVRMPTRDPRLDRLAHPPEDSK